MAYSMVDAVTVRDPARTKNPGRSWTFSPGFALNLDRSMTTEPLRSLLT
jgi:hypothetical protein